MKDPPRTSLAATALIAASICTNMLLLACEPPVASPTVPAPARQTPAGESAPKGLTPLPSTTNQAPVRPLTTAAACRLVDGGTISGSVTYNGKTVPDGSSVAIVFEGGEGLSAHTVTRGGQYSLHTLARLCAGAPKRWIGFTIHSGGDDRNVGPSQPNTHLDLTAAALPPTPSSLATQTAVQFPPVCDLVLGTLRGTVAIGGSPADDGTEIVAVPGPDPHGIVKGLPIAQTVFTRQGKYALTTVGTPCGGFEPMSLYVHGAKLMVTPDREDANYDVAFPKG
ncbi:MAG: hypothetical protein ACRDIY_15000 [Chloroflexota bacterium]